MCRYSNSNGYLAIAGGLVCLDFDECGFGPRSLDLGVIRLHARARQWPRQFWDAFAAGYGAVPDPAACALGTILRTLYMAGKVTQRPDIVPDPASKVARYLGWMEAELASLRT